MKYLIGVVVFTCCTSYLRAQYMVRIVVSSVATKPQDEIFIAGNFNDWNPADLKSKLKPFGGNRRVLVMNIDTGHYEFKFTRGSWDKVETTAKGDDIQPSISLLQDGKMQRLKSQSPTRLQRMCML